MENIAVTFEWLAFVSNWYDATREERVIISK